MLGVTDPWALAGLLLFSIAVTLLADRVAAGSGRPAASAGLRSASVVRLVAEIFWILLVFAASIIAARYIERFSFAVVGWLSFGGLAFLVSLLRARLYLRIQDELVEGCVRGASHLLVYLLSASTAYLLICLVSEQNANPFLLLPLWLGALLPDLDSKRSPLGRLLPFISQRPETGLGRCGKFHSLTANLLLGLVTTPLIVLIGWRAWALMSLGFLVHLLIDVLRPQGLLLFRPLSIVRVRVFGTLAPGSASERMLCVILVIAVSILLLAVEIGRPTPPPVPVPSYEQTVDRYYSERGHNLVYAWVEGSWQATGRRIRGTFEILNAMGESFVMLDRYDGTVFTAGRSATDDLYVNRISLSEGAAARIKPVQMHLEEQCFQDALPIMYQMQDEPGLQHIYVSGDVVVSKSDGPVSTALQSDLGQMRLRKVEAHGDGHFTVRYLTGSELVDLANVCVETADLVITATYETPASGPTVTPLPSLPSPAESDQ